MVKRGGNNSGTFADYVGTDRYYAAGGDVEPLQGLSNDFVRGDLA